MLALEPCMGRPERWTTAQIGRELAPHVVAMVAYLQTHPDSTKLDMVDALPYCHHAIHTALLWYPQLFEATGTVPCRGLGRPRKTYRTRVTST